MGGLRRLTSALLRMTALPVLRGIGGVLHTIALPTCRGLAGIFFVVAAVALASDIAPNAPSAERLHATTVLAYWRQIAPASLEGTRSFIATRMRPWVWDAVSAPLRLPASLFFVGLGLVFGYLGRRRKRVAIFVN